MSKNKKNENSPSMNSLAVLCSGGDSPGMNSAIRAVVRTALSQKLEIWGIQRGYAGLLEGNMKKMEASSVGNILQRGGTILQTARCPEFLKKEIREEASHILRRKGIDGLIVIGGDGSFKGALALHQETNIPVVGIPGTIDNDISGTDYTIGFDSAVNTAMEAVDKIRDTAASHKRIFLVEVMGRHSDSIALHVGVCTGAETIVFPHKKIDYEEIVSSVERGNKRGKNSSLIIVAEAETPGVSYKIQQELREKHDMQTHVCILGHIQRGGSPTPTDRFVAAKMGYEAVHALLKNQFPVVTTMNGGRITLTPFEKCIEKRDAYVMDFDELVKTLSL